MKKDKYRHLKEKATEFLANKKKANNVVDIIAVFEVKVLFQDQAFGSYHLSLMSTCVRFSLIKEGVMCQRVSIYSNRSL